MTPTHRHLLLSAGLVLAAMLAGCDPTLPDYTITCYPDGPSKPPKVYASINKRDFYLGKQGTSIYAPNSKGNVLPVVEYSPGVLCTAERDQ